MLPKPSVNVLTPPPHAGRSKSPQGPSTGAGQSLSPQCPSYWPNCCPCFPVTARNFNLQKSEAMLRKVRPLVASLPAHWNHTVPGLLSTPPTLITACTALSWGTKCSPFPGSRAFLVLGQPGITICAAETLETGTAFSSCQWLSRDLPVVRGPLVLSPVARCLLRAAPSPAPLF